MTSRFAAAVGLIALLSGCGGGGGDGGSGTSGAATPTPTAAAGCTLTERQNWAAGQLREWYLFPDLLPASLSPAGYSTVDDYIDALTATARSQRKDRYFTYLTSIAGENAYYSGGASGGFGIRLSYDNANRRVFVSEAFEGAPALAAGIDRGLWRADHRRWRPAGGVHQPADLHRYVGAGAAGGVRAVQGGGRYAGDRRCPVQWRRPHQDRGAVQRPAGRGAIDE